jgi:hypothetical protein
LGIDYGLGSFAIEHADQRLGRRKSLARGLQGCPPRLSRQKHEIDKGMAIWI